jgi:DNA polymerase III delta prime subunit
MNSMAFSFPLRAGKTQEWRTWIREILGPHRSEYEAFSQKLGLKTQRAYLQHTPQGDQAIIYLEGHDLQRTFQVLQTSQNPFVVWVRQRINDLFDGVDLTQTDLGSLSQYVFDGLNLEEEDVGDSVRREMERTAFLASVKVPAQNEESDSVRKEMERLGWVSP